MTHLTCCQKAYINGLNDGGMKVKDIATKVDVPLTTVYRVIKLGYTKEPTPIVETRGRPSKFTARDRRAVVNIAKKNRRMTLAEITDVSPVKAHSNTIRLILKEANMNNKVARMKPFLMPKHIVDRMLFAKEHLGWTIDQWKQVIWTDESSFEAGKSGQLRVWRTADEEFNQECTVL